MKGCYNEKNNIFLGLILFLTIIFIGCSSKSIEEIPKVSININDKEIEYISAKNKWNGDIYDREDTFITILKEQKDVPTIEIGSKVEIKFNNNPPDKFIVSDILINENGTQIFSDKLTNNIEIESINGPYSFAIEQHFASLLSSYYEPGKKDIRGFRMIASWGENECEYAFVINTYSNVEGKQIDSDENDIDRSEYLTGEIITMVITDL